MLLCELPIHDMMILTFQSTSLTCMLCSGSLIPICSWCRKSASLRSCVNSVPTKMPLTPFNRHIFAVVFLLWLSNSSVTRSEYNSTICDMTFSVSSTDDDGSNKWLWLLLALIPLGCCCCGGLFLWHQKQQPQDMKLVISDCEDVDDEFERGSDWERGGSARTPHGSPTDSPPG